MPTGDEHEKRLVQESQAVPGEAGVWQGFPPETAICPAEISSVDKI
jgi:hypothetical protein